MTSPLLRRLAVLPLLLLPFGVAAGCSSDGADTSCSTSSCTVTFDRGADAKASILGVKAELVAVEGDKVTLSVAGHTVTVPVGGRAEAGSLSVAVDKVTKDTVVVEVSR